MDDDVRTQLAGQGQSQEDLQASDHDLQKGKDETTEVSYNVLVIGQQNPGDILQKVSTLVNVQLNAQGTESLPFVPFINYNSTKYSDKSFIYGPSGCGKSRAMFEIVKENLDNFKKIYFINPRNTVGNESGRIRLIDLIGKIE